MNGNQQREVCIQNLVPDKEAYPTKMLRRIGSTVFEVSIYFSETSKETMEDKLLRTIEREVSHIA